MLTYIDLNFKNNKSLFVIKIDVAAPLINLSLSFARTKVKSQAFILNCSCFFFLALINMCQI